MKCDMCHKKKWPIMDMDYVNAVMRPIKGHDIFKKGVGGVCNDCLRVIGIDPEYIKTHPVENW